MDGKATSDLVVQIHSASLSTQLEDMIAHISIYVCICNKNTRIHTYIHTNIQNYLCGYRIEPAKQVTQEYSVFYRLYCTHIYGNMNSLLNSPSESPSGCAFMESFLRN